jgi:hypothetical protein
MRIKANDVDLYYEQYGYGEPVIFSHGWFRYEGLDEKVIPRWLIF